jgi:hypothetical protein
MRPHNIVYATYENNSYEPSISDFEVNFIGVEDPECRTDCVIVLEDEDDFQIDKKLLRAEIALPKNKLKKERSLKMWIDLLG